MAKYFTYFVPAFLVAVGFIDPGNWVTLVEGGSRFGYELAWVVCSATVIAMVFQMVSARLGVVTGKHFGQVCREELPRGVCTLLWALCEMSIITLDMTTVLGTAIGLNVILRIPTLSGLLLVAVDFLIFIAVLPLMERERAEYITFAIVGTVVVCIVLSNVPTSTLPASAVAGLLPKLRHETLYAAISIVGANVMPHNFYLHSALVKNKSRGSQSPSTLSNYCSWGTLYAFAAVLVVNLAVFSVAVSEFHNTGFVVFTLQDAQALIEQIVNNSVCPAFFGLALLCAGQLSTLNGSSAGQIVSEAFFDYQIHPWQHRIVSRGISLVPVGICVYFCGNEGIYQMLMFSQVVLALFLPLTVAPLIKVTSSERIMGSNKNSFILEIFAWLSLVVLSSVNVTLIFDLVFGDTEDGSSFGGFEYLPGVDWLTEVLGESLQSIVFGVISIGTTLSLGFLVWLTFTPLQLDTQIAPAIPSWIDEYARREEEALGTTLSFHKAFVNSVPANITSQGIDSYAINGEDLPLTSISQSDVEKLQVKSGNEVDEGSSVLVKFPDFPRELRLDSVDDVSLQHISSPSSSSVVASPTSTPPGSTTSSVSTRKLETDKFPPVEDIEAVTLKEAEAEADADAELLGKDDDEMDVWGGLEQDEVLADSLDLNVNDSTSKTLQLDGPISGRSDTSIGNEGGSGSGSLSRISGLGRAARRQFALILDDFWGMLFNLHGQPVVPQPQGRSQTAALLDDDSREIYVSHDGQRLDSKQQTVSWKNEHDMSDQSRSMAANLLRASTSSQLSQGHYPEDGSFLGYKSERRYMSMHLPAYHEDCDYQPATIHGYRTPSFPGRAGNFASSQRARQMHQGVSLFRSQTSPSYGLQGDIDRSTRGGEYNGFDPREASLSSQWGTDVVGRGSSLDTRGSNRRLTQTEKQSGESQTSSYDSSQWDPLEHNRSRDSFTGRWDPLVYRATRDLDVKNNMATGFMQEMNRWENLGHSPIGRGGQGDHVESAPLVFDELSPSQSHRDAFSIQTPTSRPQTQSLWSRQPYEQLFGTIDADSLPSNVRKSTGTTPQVVQPSRSDTNVSAGGEMELDVLETLQICLGKLLRLEGSEWLFRRDNGADEDLITAIATSQKKSVEAELSEFHRSLDHQEYLFEGNSRSHGRRSNNDSMTNKRRRSVVPNCGKGCVWDRSILVSFGVWCVHRFLELSLMESRPDLWGKYTYVLNRLQGILEPAFSKPRVVPPLCRCVSQGMSVDTGRRKTSSTKLGSVHDHGNVDFESSIHSHPHPWPWGRNTSSVKGKALSAATFLDMIKEVESAVGSRKGRTGTAAGDVAFPKGKENLASVLKRYKRRLSSKPPGVTGPVNGGRKV